MYFFVFLAKHLIQRTFIKIVAFWGLNEYTGVTLLIVPPEVVV
jgi:hypothetical protein